jgi:hypothetical protein
MGKEYSDVILNDNDFNSLGGEIKSMVLNDFSILWRVYMFFVEIVPSSRERVLLSLLCLALPCLVDRFCDSRLFFLRQLRLRDCSEITTEGEAV